MAGISPKWHGLDDVLCCKKLKKFGVTNIIWARPKIGCPHCLPDSFISLSFYLSVVLNICLLSSLSACCSHCLPVVFTFYLFCLSVLIVCLSVCLHCLSVVLTVCLLFSLSSVFVFLFCKGWKVSRIAKLKLKPQHIFGGNYVTLMSKSTSV